MGIFGADKYPEAEKSRVERAKLRYSTLKTGEAESLHTLCSGDPNLPLDVDNPLVTSLLLSLNDVLEADSKAAVFPYLEARAREALAGNKPLQRPPVNIAAADKTFQQVAAITDPGDPQQGDLLNRGRNFLYQVLEWSRKTGTVLDCLADPMTAEEARRSASSMPPDNSVLVNFLLNTGNDIIAELKKLFAAPESAGNVLPPGPLSAAYHVQFFAATKDKKRNMAKDFKPGVIAATETFKALAHVLQRFPKVGLGDLGFGNMMMTNTLVSELKECLVPNAKSDDAEVLLKALALFVAREGNIHDNHRADFADVLKELEAHIGSALAAKAKADAEEINKRAPEKLGDVGKEFVEAFEEALANVGKAVEDLRAEVAKKAKVASGQSGPENKEAGSSGMGQVLASFAGSWWASRSAKKGKKP